MQPADRIVGGGGWGPEIALFLKSVEGSLSVCEHLCSHASGKVSECTLIG